MLINGDAEAANGGEWVAVGGMDRNMSSAAGGLNVGPRNGSWMWDAGFAMVGDGGTASLTQTIDVSGCNLFVGGVELQGAWNTSAWFATQDIPDHDDFGTFTIAFAGGPTPGTTDLISKNAYSQVTHDGVLPLGATDVDVTIAGTHDGPTGIFADVLWDDVEFIIDCVVAGAKISGTKEVGERGPKRQDPLFAFGGAVGTLEGEDLVGAITINYRELGPTSCTFTPTTIAYDDDTSVAIVADYICEGGDNDGDTGIASIDMTAKDAHPDCDASDKKGRKNRGSINVDATTGDGFGDTYLDISGLKGETGTENCLATGNVIIAGPVEE